MRFPLRALLASAALAAALLSAGCGRKPADAAPAAVIPPEAPTPETVRPDAVEVKAQSPMSVTLTVRAPAGALGQPGPIGPHARPQIRFAASATEPTCEVELPSSASLEPGQSSVASLTCDADVIIEASHRDFVVVEGGRRVGEGVVQLP